MPTYKVYLADWDAMRALDDNRTTLWQVTWEAKVVDRSLYMDPYVLEAKNLEDVFEILNIRHPADYKRRSLSKGDVVVDESNVAWICASMGWERADGFKTDVEPEPDYRNDNPTPEVGMGATICYWSDRHPATVIKISGSGKTIWVQEDHAVRVDRNGMSEAQSYSYSRNPNGKVHKATLRKDGMYRTQGTKGSRVALGLRDKFHDFSF